MSVEYSIFLVISSTQTFGRTCRLEPNRVQNQGAFVICNVEVLLHLRLTFLIFLISKKAAVIQGPLSRIMPYYKNLQLHIKACQKQRVS